MRPIFFLCTLAFMVLSLSSCSKRLTYFTQDLQKEYEWSENELRKIQFYVSEDIVLQRRIKAEDTSIKQGRIKVVDGSKVEEIVFKKGTPGIFVFSPKEDRYGISFESGGDDRFLMFGPNGKAGGRYILLAKDWNRDRGLVSYDGKEYRTTSESAYASLLVDLKNAKKVSVKRRNASGRKVR